MLLNILIVDDTPLYVDEIQKQLTTWLKDTHLEVKFHTADRYASAKALIDQRLFDFAVVDLSLPDKNIHKTYSYPQQLWGGIAVLEAIDHRCPIIVVTGYGTVDGVQRIASQFGVHYSFSKDHFDDTLVEFYHECSMALLNWRTKQAEHHLTRRPTLNIHVKNGDQFQLEHSINGNPLATSPQTPILTKRGDLIRRSNNVWKMIVQNQPDMWRPEVKSIGEEVYVQFSADAEFRSYMNALKAQQSALAPIIKFTTSEELLPFPFEWLYHNQPLSLEYTLTRRLTVARHNRVESFHQWVKTKKLNQQPINVLLIGANSDGKIPETEKEVRELEKLYIDLRRLYGLNIYVTCLTGDDASLNSLNDALTYTKFDILHYAGHSYFHQESGEFSHLILKNRDSFGVITASDLTSKLSNQSIQLIFFSSCWSGHANVQANQYGDFSGIIPAVLQTQIPIIVGYRWAVDDTSARLFAQHFHQQLWHHFIPSQAMYESRHYITNHNRRRNNDTWLSALLITQNND